MEGLDQCQHPPSSSRPSERRASAASASREPYPQDVEGDNGLKADGVKHNDGLGLWSRLCLAEPVIGPAEGWTRWLGGRDDSGGL